MRVCDDNDLPNFQRELTTFDEGLTTFELPKRKKYFKLETEKGGEHRNYNANKL